MDALFYDVAHNGVTNNDFPIARHKSWFDGVSLMSCLSVPSMMTVNRLLHHFSTLLQADCSPSQMVKVKKAPVRLLIAIMELTFGRESDGVAIVKWWITRGCSLQQK